MNFNQVLAELNLITGKQFSTHDPVTVKMMQELSRQGFTETDLIAVIRKKAQDWRGTEYEQYLRPLTLFGQKFKQYHEQHTVTYIQHIQHAVDVAKSANWKLDKGKPSAQNS